MLHLTNPTLTPQAGQVGVNERLGPRGIDKIRDENVGERLGIRFEIELSEEHQCLVLNNLAKIQDLVTVYFEVVYPM